MEWDNGVLLLYQNQNEGHHKFATPSLSINTILGSGKCAQIQLNNNLDTYIWVVCDWLWVQNGHQKNTWIKEIDLHAQNMPTILGSIVNMIGETYMTI